MKSAEICNTFMKKKCINTATSDPNMTRKSVAMWVQSHVQMYTPIHTYVFKNNNNNNDTYICTYVCMCVCMWFVQGL